MIRIDKYSQKQTGILVLILIAIFAFLAILSSCSDDDDDFSQTGTRLSISDIEGSWNATTATFSSEEFTDFLATGGTVKLVIDAKGRFTFSATIPDQADEISTGKLGFDGEWLAVRFDDDPDDEASFFIDLTGGVLTLRGQTEFDLNGDGVWEFGVLELIMNRI